MDLRRLMGSEAPAAMAEAETFAAEQPVSETEQTARPLSNRFFTPATVCLTIPRAIAGVLIPILASRGKKTIIVTILAGISDKETWLTDPIDHYCPNAGMGRSKTGADLDYKADAVFGIGCAIAGLATKNSPPLARAAAGVGIIKQVKQANWAIRADLQHRRITGEKLTAEVDIVGKLGTAALIGSAMLGTVARDMAAETPQQRQTQRRISAGSLGLSVVALGLGETARRRHDKNFQAKMRTLEQAAAAG